MIDLVVPYVEQESISECWHASLQMVVEFHRGPGAAFTGHPRVRLAGVERNAQRLAVAEQEERGEISPLQERDQLAALPLRGLDDDEFAELAALNDLVAPPLPARGTASSAWVEGLLRAHGPLWCAITYRPGAPRGHIVVLRGVDATGSVVLHDPQHGPDLTWGIGVFNERLLWKPNCLMHLRARG